MFIVGPIVCCLVVHLVGFVFGSIVVCPGGRGVCLIAVCKSVHIVGHILCCVVDHVLCLVGCRFCGVGSFVCCF